MVKLRQLVSLLFKVIVSASLLYFLFSKIDFRSVWGVLKNARSSYLFLGWLSYMAIMVGCSLRWRLFTVPMGFTQNIYRLTLYNFAGAFFNLFLPTSLGGDVGRAYYLASQFKTQANRAGSRGNEPPGLRGAIVSVIVDRGFGFLALMIIASCALYLYPHEASRLPPVFGRVTHISMAVLAVVGVLPFFFGPSIRKLGKTAGDLILYWKRSEIMLKALVLSLSIQTLDVVVNIFIGFSLDLHIPLLYYFILTPLTLVASMIPVTLAGLGVREGAYVYFLSAVGVPQSEGLAVALGWLVIVVSASVIGGLILLTGILDVPWNSPRRGENSEGA